MKRPKQTQTRWRARLAGGCLGLVSGIVAVQATQGRVVPIEDLVRRADAVVHARVESVETRLGASGRQETRVELVPVDVWKGPSTNRVGLVLGSGVLGERWVQVVGEPEYRPGEEVVVFAVNNERGEAVTLELTQGKFVVTRIPGNPDGWVSNGVYGGPPEANPTGVRPPHQRPLSVRQLRERVQESLRDTEVAP